MSEVSSQIESENLAKLVPKADKKWSLGLELRIGIRISIYTRYVSWVFNLRNIVIAKTFFRFILSYLMNINNN